MAAVRSASPMLGQAAGETQAGSSRVAPGVPARSEISDLHSVSVLCAMLLLLGFLIELFFAVSLAKCLAPQSGFRFMHSRSRSTGVSSNPFAHFASIFPSFYFACVLSPDTFPGFSTP